ncbi:putative secondary metabolism biosynthetic enzyme [Sporothrix stenoceras]|uniref:Secondary metabolism biosynthetic enzyme n=1 Tax=Sporothrix stenoceras TaxID=5173 RepID=A0ABR3YMJ7_9PEZI
MAKQDPATRRVSNMTSSQVEHKRAIDRANQQICQRRKRAKMQWLEGEVIRLTGQLDAAHERIRELEAGAAAVAATGGVPVYQPVPIDVTMDVPLNPPVIIEPAVLEPVLEMPSLNTSTSPSTLASTTSNTTVTTTSTAATSEDPRNDYDSIWTVHLRELLDPAHNDDYGELGNIVFEYPMPPPDTPSPQYGEGGEITLPDWQVVPLHLPPETDLDRFIIETTNSGRRLHQQTGAAELSQAQFPSISSLLNPNLGDDGTRPLTFALATHVVRNSTVKSITTRIALMYLLSHLLRWLVCRNRQTYEKLPDFLKPTHLQRTVPHPAWVDAITWPAARDNIIRTEAWKKITFDEFRRVTGACMSVNWPYTDSGAFSDLGDGQNLVLSPLFEDHIRRASNWTLSKSTAARFPFMKEFCVAVHEGEGNA